MSALNVLSKLTFGVVAVLLAVGIANAKAATGKYYPPDMSYLKNIFSMLQGVESYAPSVVPSSPLPSPSPSPSPSIPMTRSLNPVLTPEEVGVRGTDCMDITPGSRLINTSDIAYIEARVTVMRRDLYRQEVYSRLGEPYCIIKQLVRVNQNRSEVWLPDSSVISNDSIRFVIDFDERGKVLSFKLQALDSHSN